MREIIDYMASLDFHPNGFSPDGKMHRFPRKGSKDSAWYIAWQNARLSNGEFYYVCCLGDWRTGERHVYKPEGITRAESVAIEEQIRQKQEAIRKETERVQLEVADKAERRFNAAKKEGVTPYMERKKVPNLYGCCIYRDWLQVPMRDIDGMIWSMQTIFPDGNKNYMKGGRKKGTFHVIGDELNEMFYLCEGFATGASIHQATGKPVIITFDAGNLVEVATIIGERYPNAEVIVCGDDDRMKDPNVGRLKAERAAMLVNGAVAFPKFEDDEGTDFNDIHCRYGLDALKRQLVDEPPVKEHGFIPLGYDAQTHFFYHLPSKDIVTATTFSPMQLYRLAPMDYWEARYPGKKTDLNKAGHDLIQMSSAVGPFDSTRVRGTGVWLDEQRVIINTGNHLINNGNKIPFTSLPSRYFYVQTKNRMPDIHDVPLTVKEGKAITKLCEAFSWDKPNDGVILAGWLTIARIAAALPIRPHIWITGGKGTGKSTLMESLVSPLLGSPNGKIHVIGATTEAGLRQAIRSSALPVIFDEFETVNRSSSERIDAIIELFRNSWSQSQGRILKGSANGISSEYQLCFSALVSSIRVRLTNDADKSRFCVLELNHHGDDTNRWKILCDGLSEITSEIGERLFARSCANVHKILTNFSVLVPHLARAVSQRYAQQMGILLAGWWSLENDEVIDQTSAHELVSDFVAADTETEDVPDEIECLNVLLTTKLTLRDQNGIRDISVQEAIKDRHLSEQLKTYGLIINDDRLVIANTHQELSKIYFGTRWAGSWARSLKRLNLAQLEGARSFGKRGTLSRGISIPIRFTEV